MNQKAKNCLLVQAMKEGFLHEFKEFKEENSSFLVDMLMNQCSLYVTLLIKGLKEFEKSKSNLDTLKVYYAIVYFIIFFLHLIKT